MSLSENLQRLRKEKGLSQEDVAQKLFVSRQSVSKWENGAAEPGVENLKALANLYGVTLDQLMGNESAEGFQFVEEGPNTKNTLQSNRLYYGLVAFRAAWAAAMVVFSFVTVGTSVLPLDLVAIIAGIWAGHPVVWVAVICFEGYAIIQSLNGLVTTTILFQTTDTVQTPVGTAPLYLWCLMYIALVFLNLICVWWLCRPAIRARFFKK